MDNIRPSMTIVTVCYNAEDCIEKTIKSVIEQNYQNFEYIIIDGKSTDNTCKIISGYHDKINVFISEEDRGIYDAMNKGIQNSTKQWILFLNAGDTFSNQNVLRECSFFLNNNVDIVYGDVMKLSDNHKLALKIAEEPGNKHRMYFCHQSAFTKTEVIKKYMFDTSYKMSADFKFFKQCFLDQFKFLHIPIAISIFDTSGISNKQRGAGLKENIQIIRKMDNWKNQLKLLPRLYFVLYWQALRKKKKNNNR